MRSVGIVGAGRVAALHAEAVRAVRGLRLAGLVPRSPASTSAAGVAAALGCELITMRDLTRRCDLAVIATPPGSHPEIADGLSASRRISAVLLESPVGMTLDAIDRIESSLRGLPAMAGASLLHAPAVRRVLDAIADMQPHHLELRMAVPRPARGLSVGRAFGGGVTVDPAAGYWPVLLAALGVPLETVTALRLDVADGLEHAAAVVLRAADREARADLRWTDGVAEAAIEAADADHAARADVWPTPAAEIDGVHFGQASDPLDPLAALGFVPQMERLDRVGRGEAAAWPGLEAGSAALAVAVATAVSSRRGGAPVPVGDIPRDASVFAVLNSPTSSADRRGRLGSVPG